MSNQIRVRFAPSPTGYLHVGGLRTALYNYLFARKTNGNFILRIEDTDQNRYVEGAVENLINSLERVGLEYDEGPKTGGNYGPYYQSKRTNLYKKYADKLLEAGVAYHCFCSKEELAELKSKQKEKGTVINCKCRNLSTKAAQQKISEEQSYTIRLKVPETGEKVFYDKVRGKVTIPWNNIDDQILLKSDGFPTYHLANVVDDHLMKISHVIRGEEWLFSVPKHLFMYEALGWKPPKFAHLPLLLNKDRSKLSKRQNDVAVEDYLNKGYLKEALINFIALLGWHPADDEELYDMQKLIKKFSLKRVTKAGAVFNVEKLDWLNGLYMRNLKLDYIVEAAAPFFKQANIDISNKNKFRKAIAVARRYATTLKELIKHSEMYYENPQINAKDIKFVEKKSSQTMFEFWIDNLKKYNNISEEFINKLIKDTSKQLKIKGKNLYLPLRLALIGKKHGPEIPEIINILGIDATIQRLKNRLV